MTQPRGGRRARREVGAYGNRRGKTVQGSALARATNHRVQSGLASARKDQHALDRRMAAERDEDRLQQKLAAMELVTADEIARAQEAVRLRAEANLAAMRRERWSLGEARSLVRQGYSPESTSRRTGWAVEWLEDAHVL